VPSRITSENLVRPELRRKKTTPHI